MITAVVLTRNEERHIGPCLDSLRWAAARLVVDSYSDDATVERAQALGAQVWQRPFENYADQRNAALDAVTTEWAFFVDADERATPELAAEIRAETARPDAHAGYWVPRENHIVGRIVRHAGWYPDEQLRLLRRAAAHYDPARPVHEVVLLDGTAGHLTNHLIHYNYDSWAQFHAKQRRYARLEARRLQHAGIRPRGRSLIGQPLREFWRRYVTLRGYRDGLHGLRLAAYLAWYTAQAHRELRRLHQQAG